MQIAAFALSVFAILIALGSLVFTRRADSRAKRAEERDTRRERREAEEAAARRQGRPVVIPGAISGGPTAERVSHDYTVRNRGMRLSRASGSGSKTTTAGWSRQTQVVTNSFRQMDRLCIWA